MSRNEMFISKITEGYRCEGPGIALGCAMLDGKPLPEAVVRVPIKMFNRHGLIAGATGTGKTKTLQVISENLSDNGVPVLLMDVKGDLSGLAKPGEMKPFISERHSVMNLPFQPKGYPVELLSLSKEPGVRLKATVSEFGPVLFSRILDLNDTQASVISLLFKYCDDNQIPLLDLKDVRKVIQYVTGEGKAEVEKNYGKVSTATTGIILRKIMELEQQGGEMFFGELSFDVGDLMRRDQNGNGYISIIRLTDIQDRPKLFSTFMLSLLAEVYNQIPEKGDAPRPELVIFIDEAHLIFNQAAKTLLDQIENIIKLIRSKGIGIFFVTQNPADIPDGVLAQLGLKVQHALRAFTAADRKAIKLAAENYPISEFYRTGEVMTSLGIGEALVTALNEKGIPTPLAATMLRAPVSRMDILTQPEIEMITGNSMLVRKYREDIDRESAYELLGRKVELSEKEREEAVRRSEWEKEREREYQNMRRESTTYRRVRAATRRSVPAASPVVKVLTSAAFIRGVLGILSKTIRK